MLQIDPDKLAKFDVEKHCTKIAKAGTEHAEQRAFFAWLNWTRLSGLYPWSHMAFAVPNGGKRDTITAARLKAEGVKSGVPDIIFPVPVCGAVGLAIEMKANDGSTSENQDTWHADLRAVGWQVAVCWSWRDAAQCFVDYHKGQVKPEYK